MSDLGGIVDVATIIGGIASVLAIFFPFVPNLFGRKRTRGEILNLLSASSKRFSDFLSNFGELSLPRRNWRAQLSSTWRSVVPALILGIAVLIVLLFPLMVGFFDLLRLVLPLLVAFLAVAITLGFATLDLAKKQTSGQGPSKRVLFLYHQLESMPSYLRILLVGIFGVFLKSITSYGAFFANTNLLGLLIEDLVLGFYLILTIITIDLFYTATKDVLRRIQNQFYIHYFPNSRMIVEILYQPTDLPTLEKLHGYLIEIGEDLKIRRADGYTQSIPWHNIRAIVASESSASYVV